MVAQKNLAIVRQTVPNIL